MTEKPTRPAAADSSPEQHYDPSAADLEYWAEHGVIGPPPQPTETELAKTRSRHWVERAKQNIANAQRRPHPGPINPTRKQTPTDD